MTPAWEASIVALWAFVLVAAFLLIGALRQIGLINLRLGPDPGALVTTQGLERGTQAPSFRAVDVISRESVSSSALGTLPRVLTFISTTCMSCRAVLEGLNEVVATRNGKFDFVVICRDGPTACRGLADLMAVRARVLADPSGDVERAYQVEMTPFVVASSPCLRKRDRCKGIGCGPIHPRRRPVGESAIAPQWPQLPGWFLSRARALGWL
jgi:peroxiredoxin